MPSIEIFNNNKVVEPGVYAQIKSNAKVLPNTGFDFGNVLIIDDGTESYFGGGSGISGELSSGVNSIYSFNTLREFRNFVRGGILWDLAEYLFIPENGVQGPSNVLLVRAAQTTCADFIFNWTGASNGGRFKFKCRNEGAGGNGIQLNSTPGPNADYIIRMGYGAVMKRGINDSSKYFLEFYEGTFKGSDSEDDNYSDTPINLCNQNTVCKSIEFINVQELVEWASSDIFFNSKFIVDSNYTQIIGTGALGDYTTTDYTNYNNILPCDNGTTSYSQEFLDSVISQINEIDCSFILSLKNNQQAQSVTNTKLLNFITTEAEFKKMLIIGGGDNSTQFSGEDSSIQFANFFNSENVVICHSGFKINYNNKRKNKSSLYHAALVTGRLAGLLPQTSGTYKSIRVKEWQHSLNKQQRELALINGVLHSKFVAGLGFVINQAVNTLRKNTNMVNSDGTSPEISVMRICYQLNKELVLNMKPIFVGQNLNTASPADIKAFVEGYLTQKTATRINDNLIISYQNVSVVQSQDKYYINYSFVPNSPINKIFVTGFIIDANLSV